MKWLVTGDTHGQFQRFKHLECDKDTAIIILGDVGLNFKLNCHDYWNKKGLSKMCPATFYCVKGNHEERPGNIPNMKLVYDPEVQGEVWMEDDFPAIKYFKEWGIYNIDGHKTLVMGGAYSADKMIRLQNDWPWFPSEQLTEEEMNECYAEVSGQSFDLILTHTLPFSWLPTDLFMPGIDQSTVDNSMEYWLEKIKNDVKWDVWLFGHFHQNRIERPGAEMYFQDIEELDNIFSRWNKYYKTQELDWWLSKSPNFYMGV